MKEIFTEIKNLSRNDYAAQGFYIASLLALVLFYAPFSPIARLDLETLNITFPVLAWVGAHFEIIFAILECLFAAVTILVLLKVFCDHVHLPEDSEIIDMLSFRAAKLCIIVSFVLLILGRFTVTRESAIVFNILDHLGLIDVMALFGAFLSFAVFWILLAGTHLSKKDGILGE